MATQKINRLRLALTCVSSFITVLFLANHIGAWSILAGTAVGSIIGLVVAWLEEKYWEV